MPWLNVVLWSPYTAQMIQVVLGGFGDLSGQREGWAWFLILFLMIVCQYGNLACNTSILKEMYFGKLSWIWECVYSLAQNHKDHYINQPIPDAESTCVGCEGFKSNLMSLSDSGQGCGASFPTLHLSTSGLSTCGYFSLYVCWDAYWTGDSDLDLPYWKWLF